MDLGCQNVKGDRFTALRDLLEERVRDDRPAAGHYGAIAEMASPFSMALTSYGQQANRSMARFFDAFCHLAADRGRAAARERVVRAAEIVADRFLAITESLAHASERADQELRRAVGDVNALAGQIAALNIDLRGTPTPSTPGRALREQLRRVVQDLAHLVQVDVAHHRDGAVDVSFGPGRPLVLGGSAVPITESRTLSARYTTLSSGGVVVGGDITSGRAGGLLHVRDSLLPRYGLQLDTLAHAFVARVNALHVAGVDAAGAPARDLFVPIATMSGAAAAVSVQPAVAANPLLVAAATSAPGGSPAALTIAALRHQGAVGGSLTFAQAWTNLVACAARDAQAACLQQQSREALVRQMQSLHDNLPGLDRQEGNPGGARPAAPRRGGVSSWSSANGRRSPGR